MSQNKPQNHCESLNELSNEPTGSVEQSRVALQLDELTKEHLPEPTTGYDPVLDCFTDTLITRLAAFRGRRLETKDLDAALNGIRKSRSLMQLSKGILGTEDIPEDFDSVSMMISLMSCSTLKQKWDACKADVVDLISSMAPTIQLGDSAIAFISYGVSFIEPEELPRWFSQASMGRTTLLATVEMTLLGKKKLIDHFVSTVLIPSANVRTLEVIRGFMNMAF